MLKTAAGTQALIDLEDQAPDVLFETVSGAAVPLYPQVRSLFWSALNADAYGLAPEGEATVSRFSALSEVARSFIPSRWDATRLKAHSGLCIIAGGTTVYSEGGAQRNWLMDPYLRRDGAATAVLQWAPLPSPHGPPRFPRTRTLDPLVTRSVALSRLSRRDVSQEVTRIVAEIASLVDAPLSRQQVDSITAAAVYQEKRRPSIEGALLRVLDRVEPRVVVMEDASYGVWASAIAQMKDRGILVAEPQHGWIGPSHASYNFGAAMSHPALQRTLPDELLTFGDYWGRGLRFPGRVTAVGKPHLEARSTKTHTTIGARSTILVVSGTTDPLEATQFVLSLRAKTDARWTIKFRPHPKERRVVVERYSGLVTAQGVEIDSEPDVYVSLAASAAVIGMASTVLFEARAFGCRVIVRDSPQREYYVGTQFGAPIKDESDIAELARLINDGTAFRHEASAPDHDMWAPDAKNRIQEWVEEACSR